MLLGWIHAGGDLTATLDGPDESDHHICHECAKVGECRYYCEECKQDLCDKCGKRNHLKDGPRAGHTLRAPTPEIAHGWTALHFACFSGSIETAKLLVRHGCDPTAKDSLGRKPRELVRDTMQALRCMMELYEGRWLIQHDDDPYNDGSDPALSLASQIVSVPASPLKKIEQFVPPEPKTINEGPPLQIKSTLDQGVVRDKGVVRMMRSMEDRMKESVSQTRHHRPECNVYIHCFESELWHLHASQFPVGPVEIALAINDSMHDQMHLTNQLQKAFHETQA